MEFQITVNLLDTTSDDKDLPRFVTEDRSKFMIIEKKHYNVNKEIRIKILMLRSDLYDFSGAYIVVKRSITVTDPDNEKKKQKLYI